ncbi:unnamed protein product [Brassica oleracea]
MIEPHEAAVSKRFPGQSQHDMHNTGHQPFRQSFACSVCKRKDRTEGLQASRQKKKKSKANDLQECPYCRALVWEQEKKGSRGSNRTPLFSICCQQGRVKLPPEPHPPHSLASLRSSSAHFQHNIRTYNSILAFTSMGAKLDSKVMHKAGPFTLRIHGQNAHKIGSLVPQAGKPPKFSQLYIFDTANEVKNRIATVKRTTKAGELDPDIVKQLIETMDANNCLAKVFRKARDAHENSSCPEFRIRLIGQPKRGRQYDMPTTDEIAGLYQIYIKY